jgi:chromosome segregation ATPase
MELAEFEQEVDNIIQRYGIKTDSPLKASRPPTQMSTAELQDYLKVSERFAKSEVRPPQRPDRGEVGTPYRQDRPEPLMSNSKGSESSQTQSIAKAMRALQDKIKALESDKAQALSQLRETEERYSSERNKWQTHVMEEISTAGTKEKSILSRFADVESENTSLNERNLLLQEQLKIQESQVKILQNENKHLTETYEIDRDNWRLQLEYVEKELGLKRDADKRSSADVRSLETQLAEVKEELHQVKMGYDKLASEAAYGKKTAEQQRVAQTKNFEQIEATYSKQSAEQAQRIKQLELQNRRLKEEVKTAEKTADYWKKEQLVPEAKPAKVKRAQSTSKMTSFDLDSTLKQKPQRKLRKSTSKGKLSENSTAQPNIPQYIPPQSNPPQHNPPQHNSHLPNPPLPRSSSSPLRPNPPPSSVSYAADRHKSVKFVEPEEPLSEIRGLELEISSLNRSYKQLLKETSEDATDLSTLRTELNIIAEQLEQRTTRLYELKREQQALLKSRMSSL